MTEWLHFHFSLSCIGEGNGNPLQCSCLETPRDRGAWWAAVYGVAQSRTRLKRLSKCFLKVNFLSRIFCLLIHNVIPGAFGFKYSILLIFVLFVSIPSLGFPPWLSGKELDCNAGDARDVGSIPGLGRSPGRRHGNPPPVFLPRKSHGQKRLVGYSPWGHKGSDMMEHAVHIQFSSVTQSCLTLCNPVDCSTPGFPVLHHFLEFVQTHVHCVSDAIQLSHPLLSLSPPAFNLSQHQGLFQWVSSSYQAAKVLESQFQHQSFQWMFRTDFL